MLLGGNSFDRFLGVYIYGFNGMYLWRIGICQSCQIEVVICSCISEFLVIFAQRISFDRSTHLSSFARRINKQIIEENCFLTRDIHRILLMQTSLARKMIMLMMLLLFLSSFADNINDNINEVEMKISLSIDTLP